MADATSCRYCPVGTNEEKCPRCHHCIRHDGCRCQVCVQCAEYIAPKGICSKCTRCKEHHLALPKGDFPHRPCAYKQDATAEPTYKLCDLHRTVGVELELSSCEALVRAHVKTPINPSFKYHFDHDGSVTGGYELVSGHASGDALYQGLQGLGQLMGTYACAADTTCGFHVHVDGIDYSGLELRNILVGFQLIQDQLFTGLVSPDRKHNNYCKPYTFSVPTLHELLGFTKNSEFTTWFYRNFYGLRSTEHADPLQSHRLKLQVAKQLTEIKKRKYMNEARRFALNFHSYMMRGTLEYRLKEGTADPSTILYWPLFCGYLTEALARTTPKFMLHWLKEPPSLLDLVKNREAKGFQAWLKKTLVAPEPIKVPEPNKEPWNWGYHDNGMPRMPGFLAPDDIWAAYTSLCARIHLARQQQGL